MAGLLIGGPRKARRSKREGASGKSWFAGLVHDSPPARRNATLKIGDLGHLDDSPLGSTKASTSSSGRRPYRQAIGRIVSAAYRLAG
jgi:hypothetical protein